LRVAQILSVNLVDICLKIGRKCHKFLESQKLAKMCHDFFVNSQKIWSKTGLNCSSIIINRALAPERKQQKIIQM
jgi:hypothetical protein